MQAMAVTPPVKSKTVKKPLTKTLLITTEYIFIVGKPDALSLWVESNTKPFGEKQGALIVAIYLPTKPHTHFTPSAMAGVFIGNAATTRATSVHLWQNPLLVHHCSSVPLPTLVASSNARTAATAWC